MEKREVDEAADLQWKLGRIRDIAAKYAGTRLGRQELDAEMLDDTPERTSIPNTTEREG